MSPATTTYYYGATSTALIPSICSPKKSKKPGISTIFILTFFHSSGAIAADNDIFLFLSS